MKLATLFFLLLCMVGAGCELISPKAPVPVEPASSLEFEFGAPGVYFAGLNLDGRRTSTLRLEQIPLAERLAVVVLTDQATPEFEDRHYVAELIAPVAGQRITATLRSSEEILAMVGVARQGAVEAEAVHTIATAMINKRVRETLMTTRQAGWEGRAAAKTGAKTKESPKAAARGVRGQP